MGSQAVTILMRNSANRKNTPVPTHAKEGPKTDSDDRSSLPTIHQSAGVNAYRVFVVGDKLSGKTTLVKSLHQNAVRSNRIQTFKEYGDSQHVFEELFVHSEVNEQDGKIFFKPFVLSQHQIKEVLELDPTNEEEDLFLILIVYSEKEVSTMNFLRTFLRDLRKQNNRTPVIVVGNKTDSLEVNERLASISEAKSLASSHNCKFIEVSAKSGDNVDELLFGIGRQLHFQRSENSRSSFSSLCASICSRRKSSECDDLSTI